MLRKNGATIIYTTHYMEEAEILCDRIIILDQGKVLAEGTADELKQLANIEEKVSVGISNLNDALLKKIRHLKHVDDISYDGVTLTVTYRKGTNNLVHLIDFFKDEKVSYNKIFSERPTLNDVFLELTGKELRD